MEQELQQALECIKRGEVVIYPTGSCYFLGCDAKNEQAVKRLRQIKNFPEDMPITLSVSNLLQIDEFGLLDEDTLRLYVGMMPGRLDLIIPKKRDDKYLHISSGKVSFRVPESKIALGLSSMLDSAIACSSANIHGHDPLYSIADVVRIFGNKVGYIIEAGDLNSMRKENTIYDVLSKKVIRRGFITEEQIAEAIRIRKSL